MELLVALIAAGIEAFIVVWWISSGIGLDPSHPILFSALPFAFLAVPTLTGTAAFRPPHTDREVRTGITVTLFLLLGLNAGAFLVYASMFGGGI